MLTCSALFTYASTHSWSNSIFSYSMLITIYLFTIYCLQHISHYLFLDKCLQY